MTEYLIAHIGHTGRHNEHVCWWKPYSCGYTICIDKAGRYSAAEAASICNVERSVCIAVPIESVRPLARSTPYYRLSNGTLACLYDGGPHRPVPNSRGCWAALIAARSYPVAFTHEKPTPIGAKARSIV
jgi:hypothetical protein